MESPDRGPAQLSNDDQKPADDSRPSWDEARPGDSVCWLRLICHECGTMAEAEPPADCPRCGARIEAPR